jgi:hypothetical protein
MGPVIGVHRDDVLYLTTQVAEMESHLEEALRAHCQLEEAWLPPKWHLGPTGWRLTRLVLPLTGRRLVVLVSNPIASYFSISLSRVSSLSSPFSRRRREDTCPSPRDGRPLTPGVRRGDAP